MGIGVPMVKVLNMGVHAGQLCCARSLTRYANPLVSPAQIGVWAFSQGVGMYVEIPVSGGKAFTKIDADDEARVRQHTWCFNKVAAKKYVHCRVRTPENPKGKMLKLHRFVVGVTDRSLSVDHINGDTLDNRKENLRICKQGENMRNYRRAYGKVAARGISLSRSGRYRVRIRLDGRGVEVGTFDTQRDAEVAYAFASQIFHGEFGSLPGHSIKEE